MARSDAIDGSWLRERHLPLTLDDQCLAALRAMPGVNDVVPAGRILRLRYDLHRVTLRELLPHLRAAGNAPSSALGWRWRTVLWLLTEDVQIERKRARQIDWDTLVRDIYQSQYRHRRHGRRDERPQHWRKYQTS